MSINSLSACYKTKKQKTEIKTNVVFNSKSFNFIFFFLFHYRTDPTGIFAKMDRFGLNEANVLHSVTQQPDIDDPGELSR